MARKKRLIFRTARGKFTSEKKARIVQAGKKKFYIPYKARVSEKRKIIDRARKQLHRVTFAEKTQTSLPVEAGKPSKFIWRSEHIVLNKPGKENETFNVEKWYFEPNAPILVNTVNIKHQLEEIKKNFYPKAMKVFRPGKYLFRIDTAYRDKDAFVKVDPYMPNKAGKDKLSDGRGFSIGRWLDVNDKDRLLRYLNKTFAKFLKGFETYIARKGIISGQINALTLEIS